MTDRQLFSILFVFTFIVSGCNNLNQGSLKNTKKKASNSPSIVGGDGNGSDGGGSGTGTDGSTGSSDGGSTSAEPEPDQDPEPGDEPIVGGDSSSGSTGGEPLPTCNYQSIVENLYCALQYKDENPDLVDDFPVVFPFNNPLGTFSTDIHFGSTANHFDPAMEPTILFFHTTNPDIEVTYADLSQFQMNILAQNSNQDVLDEIYTTGAFNFIPKEFGLDLYGLHRMFFAFEKDGVVQISDMIETNFETTFDFFFEKQFTAIDEDHESPFGSTVHVRGNTYFVAQPKQWGGRVNVYECCDAAGKLEPKQVLHNNIAISNFNKWDELGTAIVATDDFVLLGAPNAKYHSGNYRGKVYTLKKNSSDEWYFVADQTIEIESAADKFARFGHALAYNGSFLAVGAPEDRVVYDKDDKLHHKEHVGRVFIYKRVQGPEEAWELTTTLHAGLLPTVCKEDPDTCAHFEFGRSLAFSDDELIIGAPGMFSDIGGVFRFSIDNDGQATYVDALLAEPQLEGDRFGESLTVHNGEMKRMIIGSPREDEKSRAFLYRKPFSTWNLEITFEDINVGSRLGASSALNEDWLVLGLPGTNTVQVYYMDLTGNWTYLKSIVSEEEGIEFGKVVTMAGENEFLVSAPGQAHTLNDKPQEGIVYRYHR